MEATLAKTHPLRPKTPASAACAAATGLWQFFRAAVKVQSQRCVCVMCLGLAKYANVMATKTSNTNYECPEYSNKKLHFKDSFLKDTSFFNIYLIKIEIRINFGEGSRFCLPNHSSNEA